MEADVIHRFLESVGQKADVDLYLKLFRAQQKESFAIIAADAQMVRTALDPFHFDLRILAGLGLYPVVLLGLFDAKDADRQAQRVYDWLVEDAVPAKILEPGPSMGVEDVEDIRQTISTNTIPIVSLETAKETTTDGRFNLLSALAARLATRKVIFLSPSPGLEREGAPHISEVNVTVDYDRLRGARGQLARRHYTLLRQAKDLLEEVPHRMSIAVVSPLALLRELFTVSGAGTLIRKGSRIDSHANFDRVDRIRLRALIESAFGKLLKAEALERGVERIYIEENYLGAALLNPTPVGVYLSKFAVDRAAQGEGIGGDLWSVLIRDYPSFFWRSRPDNAITPWYAKKCDGLVRLPDWHVFWRGLTPQQIQPAVEFALSLPGDFEPPALSLS
jgi:bifunctional N-acetylglutamate synthase/kinase